MLRIEGVGLDFGDGGVGTGIASGGESAGKGKGRESDAGSGGVGRDSGSGRESGIGEEEMQALLEGFDRKMGVLRRVVRLGGRESLESGQGEKS